MFAIYVHEHDDYAHLVVYAYDKDGKQIPDESRLVDVRIPWGSDLSAHPWRGLARVAGELIDQAETHIDIQRPLF